VSLAALPLAEADRACGAVLANLFGWGYLLGWAAGTGLVRPFWRESWAGCQIRLKHWPIQIFPAPIENSETARVWNFRPYLVEKIQNGHCNILFVFNKYYLVID
jgi:hypothetical protein